MANKSGYNASLTVGTYTGTSLRNVTATINGETIDVSDLESIWRQTVPGLSGWEVTGTKAVTTEAFLDIAAAAISGQTSVGVTVSNPAGTTVFSGAGWITAASLTYPQGAAEETITVTGNGAPTVP